ncbi:hypothetical protein FACS1894176_04470 [Bacteroidia bacterium]|nr:hypothetical protein FACS1894176_04470 [Bacteroidia bacterium]
MQSFLKNKKVIKNPLHISMQIIKLLTRNRNKLVVTNIKCISMGGIIRGVFLILVLYGILYYLLGKAFHKADFTGKLVELDELKKLYPCTFWAEHCITPFQVFTTKEMLQWVKNNLKKGDEIEVRREQFWFVYTGEKISFPHRRRAMYSGIRRPKGDLKSWSKEMQRELEKQRKRSSKTLPQSHFHQRLDAVEAQRKKLIGEIVQSVSTQQEPKKQSPVDDLTF